MTNSETSPATASQSSGADSLDEFVPNSTKGPSASYMSRRATHSSRAISAIFVSLLVLAASVYLTTEVILHLLGRPALLLSPKEYATSLVNLPDLFIYPWLAVGGIVAALIGLILIIKAVFPGSLGRHRIRSERTAFILDDKALASGISASLRQVAGLGPGQVSTSVDRHNVIASVTPHAGRDLDRDLLERTLREEVSKLSLTPSLKTKLVVINSGSDS
ncbi:hypothetical protein KRX54_01885 [Actinomycetaceae bacterium TAE3-ERU4]|nr:hypothetical protein [Actinomycetaceae bacterium TAE3-ERU4]